MIEEPETLSAPQDNEQALAPPAVEAEEFDEDEWLERAWRAPRK